MVYLILIGICMALLVGAVLAASTKDGHTDMTEKEFEAEAQRSSLPGAAMLRLKKTLQPERVEYILQKGKHIEAKETESGDRLLESHSKSPRNRLGDFQLADVQRPPEDGAVASPPWWRRRW